MVLDSLVLVVGLLTLWQPIQSNVSVSSFQMTCFFFSLSFVDSAYSRRVERRHKMLNNPDFMIGAICFLVIDVVMPA